jgi:hypothetical protein
MRAMDSFLSCLSRVINRADALPSTFSSVTSASRPHFSHMGCTMGPVSMWNMPRARPARLRWVRAVREEREASRTSRWMAQL